ncbi:unnamed protein product [Cylindrotheca closterium]|uniref:Peptidase M11 gametolysin domain-containing protein n=1 Tax=Cylindrotheca closterium TaxID=2856 RepID=A0AAD2G9M1_9STRA|nr:unnamed protein product [Cylindrotheca closterium]
MILKALILLLQVLQTVLSAPLSETQQGPRANISTRSLQEVHLAQQNFPCTLYNEIAEFANGTGKSAWICEVFGQDAKNAGSSKTVARALVEGMEHVLAANPNIRSGKTTLLARGAALSDHKLTIDPGIPLTFGEVDPSSLTTSRRQRRLSATSGDLEVLVVRVSTADASLTKSKAEISGDFFGTPGSGDTINLKSLVEECSNNVARINPASGIGTGCANNPDAVFEVPRSDTGTVYNCEWFTKFRVATEGDLCPLYGDARQRLPTIDGSKTAKTECCICGGGTTINYNNNNVVDGVIDLQLSINAVGSANFDVEDAALEALQDLFGDRLTENFDNVMLCLPFGSHWYGYPGDTDWLAYADFGGYVSVYNGDKWCANEVTQVHELGHNFGLDHSWGDEEYEDETGAMGYTKGAADDTPFGNRMCFNGAHSWQLGWYTPYNVGIDPLTTNFAGILVGVDRVPNVVNGCENVVLQLTEGYWNNYVIFNHAVGANEGTSEHRNLVTLW